MVFACCCLGRDERPFPIWDTQKKEFRDMKYISTRGNAPILSFEEAMLTGLARDGGLYVPETVPSQSHVDIAAMAGKSYEEIAFQVMRPFVGGTFTDAEFTDIIAKAYANFGHSARAPMERAMKAVIGFDDSDAKRLEAKKAEHAKRALGGLVVFFGGSG